MELKSFQEIYARGPRAEELISCLPSRWALFIGSADGATDRPVLDDRS